MKKTTILLAALFLLLVQIKGQNMALTTKQQALVAIAAHEAKGDIEGLKVALNEGFTQGLTVSEAKEALSQLYAYTGFPRSLNALGALQQVIKERVEAGLRVEEGRESDPLPKDYDALQQGTRVQTQLVGGQPFNYTFAPQTDYYLKAHLFGDILPFLRYPAVSHNCVPMYQEPGTWVSATRHSRRCQPFWNLKLEQPKPSVFVERWQRFLVRATHPCRLLISQYGRRVSPTQHTPNILLETAIWRLWKEEWPTSRLSRVAETTGTSTTNKCKY